MSEGDDDPADESAVALRAKAEHCTELAKILGGAARAKLLEMAGDCLERARILEQREREK
jgi:hypothetical protein